jgi:DNA-binding HxlR family transcriptional regulator
LKRTKNDVALKDYLDKWGIKVCPIERGLKIKGQRYALHIMKNMILLKQNRFNQFLHSIEGINTKTLSLRLHELEEYGLVERREIPGKPAHTEYSPTEKVWLYGESWQRSLRSVQSMNQK